MMTLDFGLTQIFQVKRLRLHGHRRTYHQAEHGQYSHRTPPLLPTEQIGSATRFG